MQAASQRSVPDLAPAAAGALCMTTTVDGGALGC
jgi:hypothetical protein